MEKSLGLSGRVLAYHAQGPGFGPETLYKKSDLRFFFF